MKKKALSNIIATLIIISISLVAVSIVWINVKGLIDNVSLSPELNCLDIKLQPPKPINTACYNLETKTKEATLKRNINNIEINSLTLASES